LAVLEERKHHGHTIEIKTASIFPILLVLLWWSITEKPWSKIQSVFISMKVVVDLADSF